MSTALFFNCSLISFLEKRWWHHRCSLQQADHFVVSLFPGEVDQLGLDDGEAGVGRLRVLAALRYVRQKLITERVKPVCVFVFVNVMHRHPPCSTSVCQSCDSGSLSLLSSSSKQSIRERILHLMLTSSRKKSSNRKQIIKAMEQRRSYSGPCQDTFVT